RRDLGLIELVLSVALVGGVIYAVAGLPLIPTGLPPMPQDLELQLQLLVRSPSSEQLTAAALVLGWAFWLGWALVAATTLLRMTVVVAMQLTAGAAWVHSLRWLSDVLTLPFIRPAVDTSMAGTLFLRVAFVTPSAPVAVASPIVAQVDQVDDPAALYAAATSASATTTDDQVPPDLQHGDVVHIVDDGETLTSISQNYFGDADHWKQIYADNRHRSQPHHGSLDDAGKIYKDWALVIHQPTQRVEFDADGKPWHTLRKSETLWGICQAVYGDGQRWPDLFNANKGLEYKGPTSSIAATVSVFRVVSESGGTRLTDPSPRVLFPAGQQLQARFSGSATFSPSSGWTWNSPGGCVISNNSLTVTCIALSPGITIQIVVTPTPTATPLPDDPSLCAASITPPQDHGDGTASFAMRLTVASGATLESLNYTFSWSFRTQMLAAHHLQIPRLSRPHPRPLLAFLIQISPRAADCR
ncbi:MAG: LysM peptidoglycan-binding domain-containing protein, partial [Chloroflexota bacterium]|nr:LysM peptidoglycan-binding domain-containing protein [Chloroflexota bacterium]